MARRWAVRRRVAREWAVHTPHASMNARPQGSPKGEGPQALPSLQLLSCVGHTHRTPCGQLCPQSSKSRTEQWKRMRAGDQQLPRPSRRTDWAACAAAILFAMRNAPSATGYASALLSKKKESPLLEKKTMVAVAGRRLHPAARTAPEQQRQGQGLRREAAQVAVAMSSQHGARACTPPKPTHLRAPRPPRARCHLPGHPPCRRPAAHAKLV